MVHLEDVGSEWEHMLHTVCSDWGFCTGKPFPSANKHADMLAAAAADTNKTRRGATRPASNDYGLVFDRPELMVAIRHRYAADFADFGYSDAAVARAPCRDGGQLTPGIWRPMVPDERARLGGRCQVDCGPYGDQNLVYEPYRCALNSRVPSPPQMTQQGIHLVGDSLSMQTFHAIACRTGDTVRCSGSGVPWASGVPGDDGHSQSPLLSRGALAKLLTPRFGAAAVHEAVHQLSGAFHERWDRPLGVRVDNDEDDVITRCTAGNVSYTRLNRLPASEEGAEATMHALTEGMSSDDVLVFNVGVWPESVAMVPAALRWAARHARPRIIYRESLPQHFASSTPPFNEARCAAEPLPRVGLGALQVLAAAKFASPDDAASSASASGGRWSGRLTFLPAWEVLQNRSGEHRMQQGNASKADCTHYCGSSSSLRYLASAILSLVTAS